MADREPISFSDGLGNFNTSANFLEAESFLNEDVAEVKKIEPKTEERKEQVTPEAKAPEVKHIDESKAFKIMNGATEEEADETDEPSDEGTDEGDDNKQEEETNVYTEVAKTLFEQGIFSKDEEDEEEENEISTPEQLLERFELEKKKGVHEVLDRYLNSKGEEAREAFDAIIVDGIDPKDYLERFVRIQDISAIDLSSEESQERVVREYYKKLGRTQENINIKVDRLKNIGELSAEAEDSKMELLKIEQTEAEKQKVERKAQMERQQQRKHEYVNSINKIVSDKLKTKEFDGIPVDKKFAENTYHYITTEKYTTPSGQVITEFDRDLMELNNPSNHELKVKMAMLLQMVKTDPTLSKIQKRAVSKQNTVLFNNLSKTKLRQNNNKEESSAWENL